MNPVLAARQHRQAIVNAPAVATRIMIEGDSMHIKRTQDCVPIAERARAMHNEGMHGSKELKLAASIPDVIIEKYMNEHGVTFAEVIGDPVHMRRIVNDPDNKMFRIWPGRI